MKELKSFQGWHLDNLSTFAPFFIILLSDFDPTLKACTWSSLGRSLMFYFPIKSNISKEKRREHFNLPLALNRSFSQYVRILIFTELPDHSAALQNLIIKDAMKSDLLKSNNNSTTCGKEKVWLYFFLFCFSSTHFILLKTQPYSSTTSSYLDQLDNNNQISNEPASNHQEVIHNGSLHRIICIKR